MVMNANGKSEKLPQLATFFKNQPMLNIKFGVGAASRYSVGFTKIMPLFGAPSPQH
jgi:hypothetical protein